MNNLLGFSLSSLLTYSADESAALNVFEVTGLSKNDRWVIKAQTEEQMVDW